MFDFTTVIPVSQHRILQTHRVSERLETIINAVYTLTLAIKIIVSRYKEAFSTSKWPKFALSRLQYHLDNSCNASESIVKFGSHVRLISDQRRLFWGKCVVSYTPIYPLDLRLKPEPESSTWQKPLRNNRACRWEPHNVFWWIIRGNMSAISGHGRYQLTNTK